MNSFNLITRRGFMSHSMKVGMGVALSTLTDLPMVLKRALADGQIGGNGKKLIFIWLRGANDGLNSVIPVLDPAYNTTNRPSIYISPDAGTDYGATNLPADFPMNSVPTDPTFKYANAIRLGNGFAGMHPSLKFLAPVYNAGDLALIHRVAYPNQSRSHFDSQNYWENGVPNDDLVTDGIFYRTMVAALTAGTPKTSALTGVSIQSALPLILQGSAYAMTNLTDPTRYDLLGIPNSSAPANLKANSAVTVSTQYPFATKIDRDLLNLQYANMVNTLQIFAGIDFTETGNTFVDNTNLDGESSPYHLFPTQNAKNGGYALQGNNTANFVVPTSAYPLFTNLKAAALILNNTDAIIAGTEFTGFDTHNSQGAATGTHANLQQQIAWAMYSLRKFFMIYGKGGSSAQPGAKVGWDDVVIVTLSEFGRTTIQNGSLGTDHAEGGAMFVAGGAVKGFGKTGVTTGVFGCHPSDSYNGQNINWVPGGTTGTSGTMFAATGRYLQRAIDYRSVLGKLIRDHLGASQAQLNTIIPGYATPGENLLAGGISSVDNTRIAGEIPII
jgi:uncharacterized protein (DUF1501 family)